ncbi:hypothetical protein [Roseateles amylovorans]|uniref:Uncharacterized protein n=1 Tax=Roseateles amylovorans TaxID=2978473 RepID=A0ABY6AZS1_9BURK|nr:hypothetical protein [Roseateles amylovorans]UXH76803.1 hypothetical protein N4261_17415 [Roseateles amylovorans]
MNGEGRTVVVRDLPFQVGRSLIGAMEKLPIDAPQRGPKNGFAPGGFQRAPTGAHRVEQPERILEMDKINGIQELSLDDPRLLAVCGGEVGATGMGDDYHYTGNEPLGDCMIAEATGRSGAPEGFFGSLFTCLN